MSKEAQIVTVVAIALCTLALITASCIRGQTVTQQAICDKIMEQGDPATKLAAVTGVNGSWSTSGREPMCVVSFR